MSAPDDERRRLEALARAGDAQAADALQRDARRHADPAALRRAERLALAPTLDTLLAGTHAPAVSGIGFARDEGQRVRELAFEPRGRLAFVGLSDGEGGLWDLVEGHWARQQLRVEPDGMAAAAFSHDGRWLVTGQGWPWQTLLHAVASRRIEDAFDLQGYRLRAAAFDESGGHLALASYDEARLGDHAARAPGSIGVFRLEAGKRELAHALGVPGPIGGLALVTAGEGSVRLVSAVLDETRGHAVLLTWPLEASSPTPSRSALGACVTTPSSLRLAAPGAALGVVVVDGRALRLVPEPGVATFTATPIPTPGAAHSLVTAATVSPSGGYLALGDSTGTLTILDSDTLALVGTLDTRGPAASLDASAWSLTLQGMPGEPGGDDEVDEVDDVDSAAIVAVDWRADGVMEAVTSAGVVVRW